MFLGERIIVRNPHQLEEDHEQDLDDGISFQNLHLLFKLAGHSLLRFGNGWNRLVVQVVADALLDGFEGVICTQTVEPYRLAPPLGDDRNVQMYILHFHLHLLYMYFLLSS